MTASFRVLVNGAPATVTYLEAENTILIESLAGRALARARIMASHAPLAARDGAFTWNDRTYEIFGEDAAVADAFVDYVNTRSGAAVAPARRQNRLSEPIASTGRWQYAVVDIGIVGTTRRMAEVLWSAGVGGWELVHVVDKASNWAPQYEKGFMVLRRAVPADVDVDEWCITITNWT